MSLHKPVDIPNKEELYADLEPENLAPLWEVLKGLVPPEPTNKAVPYAWSYERARKLLMRSGNLLTAEEAERRVLIFENPSFVGQSRINSTLYAGMQLILPGETAPAHKHTAGALRFILESQGGYTTVSGERTTMKRGDMVITPSGSFHDHGHDGEGPVIWIDGLDVPLVNFFECGFSEELGENQQGLTKEENYSRAAFGSGLLPMQYETPYGATSPVFSYPYEQAREALLSLKKSDDPDPYSGYGLRYANPLNGNWTMPTMAAWLSHIPQKYKTQNYRATDNQVMVVVEGTVTIDFSGRSFSLGENDVLTLPGWTWRNINAHEDAILFFFSDRSAQEQLGFWREERGNK